MSFYAMPFHVMPFHAMSFHAMKNRQNLQQLLLRLLPMFGGKVQNII
jgi:hypothetical protein